MAHAHKYMIPALQRAFQEWHERVREDLAVPIYPTYTTRGVEFDIIGVSRDFVLGQVRPDVLSVSAMAGTRMFDCLFHVFGGPAADGNVYVEESFVTFGGPEDIAEAPKFATKAALWEHYLFEPFAHWLEAEYKPSNLIEYSAWGRGWKRMRMAELRQSPRASFEPGVKSMRVELHHEFYADLKRQAEHAETHDGVDLSGLSAREVVMVMAVSRGDETIGSFDITGMSDDAFHAVLTDNDPDPPLTEAELATGRDLLAARRKPRSPQ